MSSDLMVMVLTLKLALIVTVILLILTTPIAWWLSQTKSRLKSPVSAIVSLPLVLPPTVLGFYLLLLMGPHGPIGHLTQWLGVSQLPFTFAGIVIGCVIHTLPFVLQPVQNAFEAIGHRPLEVAATLRMPPLAAFFKVALPLASPGFFSAAILGFCHSIGEFGVVLMIGGNIPGQTRVMSVEIYNHVEALEYGRANQLAAVLVGFSFVALLLIYLVNSRLASRKVKL